MAYGVINSDLMTTSDGVSSAGLYGFKNRLINGGMVIDQRNAGASVTVPLNGGYTLDRWNTNSTQASKFSVQRNAGSVTPPAGYTNYLGVTSLSAYSVLTSDFFSVIQSVEGFNAADLAWGTANAQTVTLSFWVRSSLTGTFGGSLNNSGFARSYPFTFTINSANTWEKETITITGDTSGTWLTTNGVGIHVYFNLGAGATYSTTAGAWASGTYVAPTGATSVVGTNGATFYITGVQLEKGSTATSFDYRPYGTELALCQRYLPAFNYSAAAVLSTGSVYTSTQVSAQIPFRVSTRVPPTGISITSGTILTTFSGGSAFAASAIAFSNASTEVGGLSITVSGATQGHGSQINFNAAGQLLFTGCEL
jgi:hypothetical protein